ncbi:MAG: PTS transporter subunit EIIC [Mycoplasmatales bacterium]
MKAFLSKLGQSFMLPIALLPAAGIMLGIGGSFTNENMIEAYNLKYVLGEGTIAHGILSILNAAGDIVFSNLPLMFGIAIAIAFAKKDKGTAALAAVMSYLIMHAVGGSLITSFDLAVSEDSMLLFGNTMPGMLTTTLGIEHTLSMGVFGGIISGGIAVILHNKYNDVRLPDFLGFFGGPRFVPIIASFAALFYGVALVFIWPFIGIILNSIGGSFSYLAENNLGWLASGIHGYIERSLIPMGLHHVYYMPLWQTAVGGTYDFAQYGGEVVVGTQNAFFEALKLGGDAWNLFPATNFMTGKFPFMMFGLPAAAYAMYSVADKENKKEVGGLLFSIGLTAFLTGITEPIEFTFLFLAPGLYYGVHAVLASISFALMDVLQVKVGMTFSGGFIDFALFGVLPWTTGAENHVWYIVLVGIILAPIYYFTFRWWILKFDIKTPGRGGAAIKTVSKQEYRDAKGEKGTKETKSTNTLEKETAEAIVKALGGKDNLDSVTACITRLRVSVKDETKVADDEVFKGELAAMGVSRNGKAIQVIYGAKAAIYSGIINEEIL